MVLGAAYSAQFWSMSAPTALCSALAPTVDSWMRRTRSAGSASLVGRLVNMADTLLPMDFSPSGRTDTGQVAMSGVSGSSSRSIM